MLVGCYEGFVAKLVLKIVSKGFDTIAHAVSCSNVGKVLKEIGDNPFVDWLFKVVIVVAAVSLLLCSQLFTSMACESRRDKRFCRQLLLAGLWRHRYFNLFLKIVVVLSSSFRLIIGSLLGWFGAYN